MKWLKTFLKRRRQDDRVKIILMVILLGSFMLANSIYRVVKLQEQLGERVEYILAEEEQMPIKDSELTEWKELEHVVAISRQTEEILTIYEGEEAVMLNCIGLSDEYLSEVYGIAGKSSDNTAAYSVAKVFYLNQQAYDMLLQAEGFQGMALADGQNAADAITIEYSMGEDEKKYKGKIVPAENNMGQDLPCAFFKSDKASLKKNTGGVRICVTKDDLAGEMKNYFMGKGYVITNSDAIYQRNYQYEIEILHIKYSLFIAGCCFLLAYSIKVKFM